MKQTKLQRVEGIQRYLTGILLQEQRMQKYMKLIDFAIFWKYKPVWDYVNKNGNGNEPDLVSVSYDCGISNPEEVMNLAFTDYTGDPIRYLKEILEEFYFSDRTKINHEQYENLVRIKWEIDNIRNWEDDSQYSLQSIASEMLDKYSLWTFWEKIKTGIDELDEILWGGVSRWTVTRITAYSNTGKSKLAYFIASNILKQWKQTIFFNLEVPRDVVIQNIFASYSWKQLKDIIKSQGIWGMWEYLNEYMELPLKIVDNKWDWESIKSFAEKYKPEVMFIDFIQNIEIEWSTIYEQMSKIAKRIQRLAIENNIAIIDVSQMSNDGAKNYKVGDMIPSKWGGELVASTDVGLVLMTDSTRWDILHLTVAKNKFGRKEDTIDLCVNFALNRFTVIGTSQKKQFAN